MTENNQPEPVEPTRRGWPRSRKIAVVLAIVAVVAIAAIPGALAPAILIAIISSPFVLMWRAEVFMRKSKARILRLANEGGLDGIGVLLQTLDDSDKSVRLAARDALIRLLPTFQSSDALVFLSSQHRRILLRCISGYVPVDGDMPLILAILKVVEQIGDEACLPVVQRLAQGRGMGLDERVKAAANECLYYLWQRIERRQAHGELLRGSASPATDDSGRLLRAAIDRPSVGQEELLRPHEDGPPAH